MNKDIKLICLDLDGTTLKDVSNISKRNIKLIKKAYEQGIKIAFSTGRIFVHCLYFSEIVGIPAYIISNNGTYVYDNENKKVIYSSFLGVDNLLKIHKFVKGKPFNVHYSTMDTIFSNEVLSGYHDEDKKGKYAMKEVVISDESGWNSMFDSHGNKISKAVISSRNIDEVEDLIRDLRPQGFFELEYSWENTLEILKKGEGKGTGLKNLKNYLGIDTESIMSIGDSGNDISMFRESGYRVAMGNAINELKSMADFITSTVYDDGVANAIEKLLLGY